MSTPSDPHVHLCHPMKDDGDTNPPFPYQEIVGSLFYLAMHSRLDVACAVSIVAQYSSNY